jgi:quercetin dioxygenase-like cupin family protein
MIECTIMLFWQGARIAPLIILLSILSLAGFFLWRMLLAYFLKKGQTGLNIAAFIVATIQAPLLFAIVVGVFYFATDPPERLQMVDRSDFYDSIMQVYATRDAAYIDIVKASPDNCKVLLENEYVRVLQYSLKPNESDNPHTHPPKSYYVVSGGTLRVYPENGEPFNADEVQGVVEWSGYVGKHYVQNIGNTTVTLLLTEVKGAAGH